MPKWRLSQLLEELLTDLGEKDRDLIFVVLLLETGIVEKNQLGRLRKRRKVAVVIPWLLPLPFAFPIDFPTQHGTEAQDW